MVAPSSANLPFKLNSATEYKLSAMYQYFTRYLVKLLNNIVYVNYKQYLVQVYGRVIKV